MKMLVTAAITAIALAGVVLLDITYLPPAPMWELALAAGLAALAIVLAAAALYREWVR